MEPRRLLIAALLLAGLSGLLWWSNKEEGNKDKTASPDDAPKIVEIPQDQIQKVELRRMGAEPVVLEKGAAWMLQSPKALPADPDAVNALVSTLAVLPSDRLVDDKTTDLKPYGLTEPLITVVVRRKDGKTHTLQIGDNAPSGSAAYARMDGETKLYTISSSTKATFEKTWRDLRDRRLLPFDAEKLTRVELTAKGSSVELGKNNGNTWAILKPRPLRADNFAAEELVRKLKDARLEVVNDTEEEAAIPGQFAAAAPVGIAKVTDAKGTMQLEVRKGKDNAYFAKSSAVEGVFKTSAELGDGLGKGLDDLRNKKLFEFGFNQPDRVEVKQDGTAYTFTKAGAEWKKDGKSIDPGSVQQIVDRLRELSAIKFAETAAGAVTAEYSVGKETVTVTKQGETYFARRANEPDVYVLDGKTLADIRELAAGAKELPPASADKDKKK
ncbi:MAG TPA: DUF4340 domain-containing protein [Bryobacteraceae bacterium]|nr:DUF4340 domain-containing protein [Bryobacteraceae bacterium]